MVALLGRHKALPLPPIIEKIRSFDKKSELLLFGFFRYNCWVLV